MPFLPATGPLHQPFSAWDCFPLAKALLGCLLHFGLLQLYFPSTVSCCLRPFFPHLPSQCFFYSSLQCPWQYHMIVRKTSRVWCSPICLMTYSFSSSLVPESLACFDIYEGLRKAWFSCLSRKPGTVWRCQEGGLGSSRVLPGKECSDGYMCKTQFQIKKETPTPHRETPASVHTCLPTEESERYGMMEALMAFNMQGELGATSG
nr:ubiquitin-like-conjugating enzyme ATG10 isoform X5 [Rattus norvegicus]